MQRDTTERAARRILRKVTQSLPPPKAFAGHAASSDFSSPLATITALIRPAVERIEYHARHQVGGNADEAALAHLLGENDDG